MLNDKIKIKFNWTFIIYFLYKIKQKKVNTCNKIGKIRPSRKHKKALNWRKRESETKPALDVKVLNATLWMVSYLLILDETVFDETTTR